MKKRKRIIALITSLVLLVGTAMPVSAASYVSGTISGSKISANGSLSWSQGSASSTATATTRSSSNAGVTVSMSLNFLDAGGKTLKSYSSQTYSGTNSKSHSKSWDKAKGHSSFRGTHKATYSGGSWTGGTSW